MKIWKRTGIKPQVTAYPQKTRGGRGGRAQRAGRLRRMARAAAAGANAAIGRGGAREETVGDIVIETGRGILNRFRRNR